MVKGTLGMAGFERQYAEHEEVLPRAARGRVTPLSGVIVCRCDGDQRVGPATSSHGAA